MPSVARADIRDGLFTGAARARFSHGEFTIMLETERGSPDGCSDDNYIGHAVLKSRFFDEHDAPAAESPSEAQRLPWEHLGPTLFGVIFPAVAIAAAAVVNCESLWHMTVRRPVETLIEMAFIVAVPILNQRLWTAFARCDGRHPIRVGVYAGVAITTSLITLIIASACLFLGYPTIDEMGAAHTNAFTATALVALGSLVVGGIGLELIRRAKLTRAARTRSVLYSLIGVLLTLVAGAACETQSVRLRLAERGAITSNGGEAQREAAVAYLRSANPDRELWMDCADPATAGIAGLFAKFDASTRAKLYFAATGKPYVDARTGDLDKLTDDSLSRHVIGDRTANLSLRRSAITGLVSATGLVSTMDWTFVFKNEDFSPQEARAEIALPQGASVTGLTLWINGEPRQAAFGSATTVNAAYHGINLQKRDPALVTDLGRGRVLLQCSPIPARGEAKVSVAITAPLKLDNLEEASMTLPRFVNANFTVSGDHAVRLRSTTNFLTSFAGVSSIPTDQHDYLLRGKFKDNDLSGSGVGVRVQHNPKQKIVYGVDSNPKARESWIASVIQERPAAPPQRIVVVVDGSQAMAPYKEEIVSALASIPRNIATSVILASPSQEGKDPLPLPEFLESAKKLKFEGGQDNLESLIQAAELAGETKRSAVLWLHGPQPSFNREMYILAPYVGKPQFYELPLDDGWTNTSEFLSNHKEIGPFTPIIRNASVREDLERFFAAWRPGANNYTVKRVHLRDQPKYGDYLAEDDLKTAISRLAAQEECRDYLTKKQINKAIELSTAYHLVNKTTGAVVLERTGDYVRYGLHDPNAEPGDEVAINNTATNGGTIGEDQTVIMGISTGGSVRVNNLANLESFLNLIANGLELLGLCFGLVQIIGAVLKRPMKGNFLGMFHYEFGPVTRFLWGFACILGGLAIPGMITWLIASARDANLFS